MASLLVVVLIANNIWQNDDIPPSTALWILASPYETPASEADEYILVYWSKSSWLSKYL